MQFQKWSLSLMGVGSSIEFHLLVSNLFNFFPHIYSITNIYMNSHGFNNLPLRFVSDLRYSGQWSVRRHVSQGEAAPLVPEDDGQLPGHPLRQLHHQLEGRQTLQCCHTQALVSAQSDHTVDANNVKWNMMQAQTAESSAGHCTSFLPPSLLAYK